MRIPAILMLLGMFLSSLFITTALDCMEDLSSDCSNTARSCLIQIEQGQILRLLEMPEFWTRFPSMPNPRMLLSLDALVFSLIMGLASAYFARMRWMRSFLFAGISCLLSSAIPYLGELSALGGNTNLAYAAGWHSFALNSALYNVCLCGFFAFLHLRTPHAPQRRVRIFQGPAKREVPPLLDISSIYLSRWL